MSAGITDVHKLNILIDRKYVPAEAAEMHIYKFRFISRRGGALNCKYLTFIFRFFNFGEPEGTGKLCEKGGNAVIANVYTRAEKQIDE